MRFFRFLPLLFFLLSCSLANAQSVTGGPAAAAYGTAMASALGLIAALVKPIAIGGLAFLGTVFGSRQVLKWIIKWTYQT